MEAYGSSYPQYGAPVIQHYGTHRVANPQDPPRELSGLAWGVYVSLGVMAILSVVRIVTTLNFRSAAGEGIAASAEIFNAHHTYSTWVGFYGLAFLISGGVFIAWFFRAYKNLRRLGVWNMRYGDGWAIGAWFIPFFNLVRPKQIANDIWRGSEPGVEVATQWRQVEVPGLVHWWWALYLTSGALAYVGERIAGSGYEKLTTFGEFSSGLSQIKSGTVVDMLGEIVAIAAVVVAIKVVSQITERLDGIRSAALAGGSVAPVAPPPPMAPPPIPSYAQPTPRPASFSPPPPAPPPSMPTPPPPSMPAEQRIQCPECAEWIQAQANVCRFCGHRLNPAG